MSSTEEAKSSRSGGSVLVALLALVVGLAVGGLAGVLSVGPMLAKRLTVEGLGSTVVETTPRRSQSTWEPGVIYQLENLVVNPASSQGTRFLLVSLAVELDDPETAAELERREPEARDAVLRVLGSKTVAQLSDISARDSLKTELIETLAEMIDIGELRRLYIPQFVIQ